MSEKITRRAVLRATGMTVAGASLAGCVNTGDSGGSYPSNDIEWIVPFGPGGSFDAQSRIVAEHMPDHLDGDVNVVVENVEGAGGQNGVNELYRSDPDGYTMGMLHGPVHSGLQVLQEPEYDLREMEYVGRTTNVPHILAVRSDLEYQTIEELRNADKPIKVGVAGIGHAFLVVPAMLELGIEPEFVTGYGGSAETSAALLRGDVDAIQHGIDVPTLIEGLENGDMTGIVVFSDEAPDYSPDIPTADEAGFSELVGTIALSQEIAVPPETDEDRLETLRSAFSQTVESDAVRSWAEENEVLMESAEPSVIEDAVETWLKTYEANKDTIAEYV